jgi:surface protein
MGRIKKVSTMSDMFYEAREFDQDLSLWSVEEDMSFMFDGASSLNSDITAWDISKVSTMQAMLYGATIIVWSPISFV